MKAKFFKYQALGNDMIVLDPVTFTIPLDPKTIQRLCHRHIGIGADGICFGPIVKEESSLFAMRFYNPDGSESEKSGNGLRIFARYLWDTGYVKEDSFHISINNEIIPVKILDPQGQNISIEMGQISFQSKDVHLVGNAREVIDEDLTVDDVSYRITAVSIGNPHCIIFSDDLSLIHQIGPILETSPYFLKRTNVQLLHVLDKHSIKIAIWERGAGHTLASGTSATATAGAAVRHGLCTSPVTVFMDGGISEVLINENWQATLIGEVESICEGTISPDLLQAFNS